MHFMACSDNFPTPYLHCVSPGGLQGHGDEGHHGVRDGQVENQVVHIGSGPGIQRHHDTVRGLEGGSQLFF